MTGIALGWLRQSAINRNQDNPNSGYVSTAWEKLDRNSAAAVMAKSRSSPRHLKLRQLLVEARKKRGLSQVELAEALGKPQSFVSKYETGERRLDVIELIDVAAELDCSVKTVVEALLAVTA